MTINKHQQYPTLSGTTRAVASLRPSSSYGCVLMLQETQKLAKTVASNMEETNQKLAPKIKEAYDDFVKQAEQVQKKLHEAATKQ